MRIFLTGATGYIGSAVLDALLRAGHEVAALVRTGEKAPEVQARGARAVLGNLANPLALREAAQSFDGYVHAAFDASARGPDLDRQAIEILAAAAREAAPAFLIYTSGCWILGNTSSPAREDAAVNPPPHVAWRPAHERLVLDAAGDDLRTIVVRPGIVYGGARGIVGGLFKDAGNGLMRVIGNGHNHWPLVYDRDLGDLYALLASRPEVRGIYHANDEGDERVNEIVEAIGAQAPVRPATRHIPLTEARAKMGSYADALALDQVMRSPRARSLGWSPSVHSVAGNVHRLFEEWRRGREAA